MSRNDQACILVFGAHSALPLRLPRRVLLIRVPSCPQQKRRKNSWLKNLMKSSFCFISFSHTTCFPLSFYIYLYLYPSIYPFNFTFFSSKTYAFFCFSSHLMFKLKAFTKAAFNLLHSDKVDISNSVFYLAFIVTTYHYQIKGLPMAAAPFENTKCFRFASF